MTLTGASAAGQRARGTGWGQGRARPVMTEGVTSEENDR